MTETKHTPGPWRVFGNHVTTDNKWSSHDDVTICDYIISNLLSDSQRIANAYLLAAAPCLLKELQHLVRLMEPKEKEGGLDIPGLATLNGARAAIAKATGNEESR